MKNPEIFEGKTFQDILKDIYDNSVQKKRSIQILKDKLSSLINNIDAAAVITPLVKDLLDVEVKNDEHLVKIATIVQRLLSAESSKSSGLEQLLSEQEKQDLLSELDNALLEDEKVEQIRKTTHHLLEVENEKKSS